MSLFSRFRQVKPVARTFWSDIPLIIEYDWGQRFSSFAQAASAKHADTGEEILVARFKGFESARQAIVSVDALKSGKKVFTAEATFAVPPLRSSRLVKAVIDGTWLTEYHYSSEHNVVPNVVTKEIASNRVVAKSTGATIDVERSWADEEGRIASTRRDAYDAARGGFGSGMGGLGHGRLMRSELPVASDTAVMVLQEICLDKNDHVIYCSKCWRNNGTGFLIDEVVEEGTLPRDYHHYELLSLCWPMA